MQNVRHRFLFVSPVFDETTKERLARKAADLMADIPEEHGITDWLTMDIPDMLEGKGPQPLQLPGPKP